jgi:hypothetical protein
MTEQFYLLLLNIGITSVNQAKQASADIIFHKHAAALNTHSDSISFITLHPCQMLAVAVVLGAMVELNRNALTLKGLQ